MLARPLKAQRIKQPTVVSASLDGPCFRVNPDRPRRVDARRLKRFRPLAGEFTLLPRQQHRHSSKVDLTPRQQ
jgi:hypothetical protein